MADGRNGGGRKSKPRREIPFSAIERDFTLAEMNLGLRMSPAVLRTDRGYSIRVHVATITVRGREAVDKFDYFYLSDDGEVQVAPRGFAKDYKPGRVTGMDEAVERYAGGAR